MNTKRLCLCRLSFQAWEFLATGKPVIASNVSDIAGILTNKSNAMIGLNGHTMALSQLDYRTQGETLINIFAKL